MNASYGILHYGIFGEYEANDKLRIEKEWWLLIVRSVVEDVIFVVVTSIVLHFLKP